MKAGGKLGLFERLSSLSCVDPLRSYLPGAGFATYQCFLTVQERSMEASTVFGFFVKWQ